MSWRQSFAAGLAWLRGKGGAPRVVAAYAAVVLAMLFAVGQFYLPGQGFTTLIAFGEKQAASRLSKLRALDYHVERDSDGYDAQYYAQIAMDPSLQNRELRRAVDSLPYRARRILFSAAAYAGGLGEPRWILQVFALENVVAWLLLAALLTHWFPPNAWENFFRWAGVLLSFGLCVSVRNSLVDGPSLLLIAGGIYLLEKGWGKLSVAVLAISGLGKETNLLGAAAFAPASFDWRLWLKAAGRALAMLAPLALWLVYIKMRVPGDVSDVGYRNFAWPLVGYWHKWRAVLEDLPGAGWKDLGGFWSLLMLITLTAQAAFFLCRPQWKSAWWRVGASYAVLMIVLGDAVWEGFPGAASRVLLPMQLAFNVLLPAGRRWIPWLVLGNLTFLASAPLMRPPPGSGIVVEGASKLLETPAGARLAVTFSPEWYGPESGGSNYWNWARDDASIEIVNPHPAPLVVQLRFGVTIESPRRVSMQLNGVPIWDTVLRDDAKVTANFSRLVLAPGANRLEFHSDQPPAHSPPDPRAFAYCIHNFRLDLRELAAGEGREP